MNKPTNKSTLTILKNRFTYLKSLYRQAPLPAEKMAELIKLAERFDKKMAEYLKQQ